MPEVTSALLNEAGRYLLKRGQYLDAKETLERITALMLDGLELDALLGEMARIADSALALSDADGRLLARTTELTSGEPGVETHRRLTRLVRRLEERGPESLRRERALEAGLGLSIGTTPGGGTTIRVQAAADRGDE